MNSLSKRDRIIPWYFVMFFAVIALVNGVMVTLAVRTHTGIITEHPYEKGLAYNEVVEAASLQEKLGWSSHIDYKDGQLQFVLWDASKQLIAAEQATAHIIRPTQSGMDFSVALTNGVAAVTFPRNGLWEVRVDVQHKGSHYQQARRIVVP